ncbi:yippee-domain-containing protein [Lindgomyces ingoldianus]|uniref:Yippee-domain-containing protein n=1 Tax=Lindgomyces ingoldianus TaxID=673940 RepID=A0ACB6RHU4_9PLEO|nr:yippee-domain-containing protein [Lindgomyces ingoldianus]KAF2478300.1 yippee-domain-containing protein [Lindgomyces ingoldianus]
MTRSATAPTTPFPLYLLPSNPFRSRRRSSTLSTTPTSSPSTSPPTHPTSYLSSSSNSYLRCHKCLTDLIPASSIISKGFTGRHGRAYLVAPPPPQTLPTTELPPGGGSGSLPNTNTGKPVPRQLVTGAHTVSDISCRTCTTVLGWKYVDAEEETQKYKVGKFILETRRVVRGVDWENGNDDADSIVEGGGVGERTEGQGGGNGAGGDGEIEFDSEDEDECEDLFSGIWSPGLARRRRKNRRFGREEEEEE